MDLHTKKLLKVVVLKHFLKLFQVFILFLIFRVWLLVVVCLRLGDGRVQTLNIFNSLSTKYFLAEVIFQVNYKMRNMKYLQWAELFLTTSHLSSSSWSKLVRDNFAEKLWCCCLGSALLEAGLVWGCRGWSLPQHFLQTIRGVRTAACHQVRIQHLLHNLMKMDVLHGASWLPCLAPQRLMWQVAMVRA